MNFAFWIENVFDMLSLQSRIMLSLHSHYLIFLSWTFSEWTDGSFSDLIQERQTEVRQALIYQY